MSIFTKLVDYLENFALSDLSESKKFINIVALAVYMDKKICEEEVKKAKSLLISQFQQHNLSHKEIELILYDFDEKLDNYKKNEDQFLSDKVWIRKVVKESTQKESQLITNFFSEIFDSDDIVSPEERNFLESLQR